ncbi:single-stranded-DNA-specific exonuclease RecJ [Candidatus Peregrinibacteria bacterium]|nr:single-stranded-DNA-specific exonuclease RecJ [Candidatus Peregrinibacteria bacterium]
MSVLQKTWQIKNSDPSASLLQKLLSNRGLKDETAIEHFFHPDPARDFHDPFLMEDMERAVARIGEAIEKSQRIMIFGDYDVDGITGTAILMRSLRKLGANVSYRLPHRIEDGYGMREKFIREFAKLDVKLAITVDNGISCFNEVELANKLGVDIIITDHHTVPEKNPNACAILHPKLPGSRYPFTELTGAGVALKLAQALLMRRMNDEPARLEEITKLLDLACMGTIADLGELKGENRYIVKEGLRVLENTRWPGLSRLKEFAGVKGKIDTHDIGFLLSPRINAAGRISHPSHALQLLLNDSKNTTLLAENLERLNRKRQTMMAELFEKAEALAEKQSADPIIIIGGPEFHGGIIGLIAGKLSEKYSRPVIAMEERPTAFVGSCRSIPTVNIVQALAAAKSLLTNFGGHAAAAGFEIAKENRQKFEAKLKTHVGKMLRAKDIKAVLPIECEISHDEISEKTIEMLQWFEPFGIGNEVPRFLCRNVLVQEYSTVGADLPAGQAGKKHLKIIARLANGDRIDCIGFSLGQFANQIQQNKPVDLVAEVERDEWNGRKKIQLKFVDLRIAE